MTSVLFLQGLNLDLVGAREPEIYSHESLEAIARRFGGVGA
jgi:3-dehydroquinate dehydratase